MSDIYALIKAMDYIESHLLDAFDLNSVAAEAGYSLYHFHRVFKSIVKDSLKDYIRKRRITEAAKDLIYTTETITDLAVKYHYETRESFSRSFKKIYGIPPSEVRQKKIFYTVRERLSEENIRLQIKQLELGMTPSFVHLPKQQFTGKKINVHADGSNLKEIPLFWSRWNQSYRNENTGTPLGICIFSSNEESFEYMIGLKVQEDNTNVLFCDTYSTQENDYAVFRVETPIIENVQKTWDYIYSIWLNQSGFKHSGTHDIESYHFDDHKPYVELLVPISKYKYE